MPDACQNGRRVEVTSGHSDTCAKPVPGRLPQVTAAGPAKWAGDPKLRTQVRFPSPAPPQSPRSQTRALLHGTWPALAQPQKGALRNLAADESHDRPEAHHVVVEHASAAAFTCSESLPNAASSTFKISARAWLMGQSDPPDGSRDTTVVIERLGSGLE